MANKTILEDCDILVVGGGMAGTGKPGLRKNIINKDV